MSNHRISHDYVSMLSATDRSAISLQAALDALDALSAEALRIRAQLEAVATRQNAEQRARHPGKGNHGG
jgi:hypothetical protein